MKITICASDRALHFATGPNTWLQRLIPFLLKKGIDIQVLILFRGELELCPTINFLKETEVKLETLSVPLTIYLEDQSRWILKCTKKFKPNLFFCNLVVPAFFCGKYIKKAGITVLGMLHSNDAFYQDVLSKFVILKTDYQFDHIIVVSEMLEKQLLNSPVNPKRIHRIPYGSLLPERFARFDDSKLKVIYLGRLEIEQKQILKVTESFCNLAKRHKNLEFSIYGSGSKEAEIEALILEHGVQHNVFLKGAIKQEDVYKVLREHQIFTLLSDYEGLPIALQEAMACGLVPVCLNEESGVNELINHGENGFIVNNRSEDYYKHVEKFIDNRNLWEAFSEKSRRTIQEKYDMNKSFETWSIMIGTIASTKTKPIKIPVFFNFSRFSKLPHGDFRKPKLQNRVDTFISKKWHKFKLFVRPRARLRSLFEIGKR